MTEQKETTIAAAQAALQEAIELAGAHSVVAGHDSIKLHDIEKHLPNRLRFRGLFRTSSLTDFVANILSRNKKDVRGFIQTKDQLSCEAIFNLGNEIDAGHADDKAVLLLEKTPEFAAAVALLGNKLSQKTLATFLEDWRHCVTAHVSDPHDPDAGSTEITIGKAITAIRSVTISSSTEVESKVTDVSYTRSAMENIEAKSKENSLPSHLKIKTTAYPDMPIREIQLRISINTGDSTPFFSMHFVGQQAFMEQVGQDFKDRLVTDLSGTGVFLLGSFQP
ncbi:MAG: hypothetical protein RLY58_2209 [Pseudomonadota bacterium]|jgi:uncharacterized protein YfdQ (DUF2303 family)